MIFKKRCRCGARITLSSSEVMNKGIFPYVCGVCGSTLKIKVVRESFTDIIVKEHIEVIKG